MTELIPFEDKKPAIVDADQKHPVHHFSIHDVHYPVITPYAPTRDIFAVTTVPRAGPSRLHPRLIRPRRYAKALRFPPVTPADIDAAPYAAHPLVLSKAAAPTLLFDEHPARSTLLPGSPGHSDLEVEQEKKQSNHQSSRPSSPPSPPPSSTLRTWLQHDVSVSHAVRSAQRNAWCTARPPPTVPSELLDDLLLTPSLPTSPSPVHNTSPTQPAWQYPPASNPLSAVRLSDGRHAVVYPSHSTLDSLTVGTLFRHQHRVASAVAPRTTSPAILAFDNDPVIHVRTTDAVAADPARLLALTCRTALLATIAQSPPYNARSAHFLNLQDMFTLSHAPVDAVLSTYVDEVALLTAQGLHVSPFHLLSDSPVKEIHPLSARAAYTAVSYSPHPRILWLANCATVATLDLRAPHDDPSPLFHLAEWRLPHYDDTMAVFTPASLTAFHVAAATRSALVYFDTRVPAQALLRLPYEYPTPITRLAISRFLHEDTPSHPHPAVDSSMASDIVAYAAPAHRVMGVAHAVHMPGAAPRSVVRGVGVGLPEPRVVWGDEPFHVGMSFPPVQLGDCPGLCILPEDASDPTRKRKLGMHVVSWTRSTGLTAVPFELFRKNVLDGENIDEDDNDLEGDDDGDGDGSMSNGSGESREPVVKLKDIVTTPCEGVLDNSLNIAREQRLLAATGVMEMPAEQKWPVSESVGVKLHALTKRLVAELTYRLRDWVCDSWADEVVDGVLVPRPAVEAGRVALVEQGELMDVPDVCAAIQRSPMLLQDVAELLRSGGGGAHMATPLAGVLGQVLEASRAVQMEEVKWHEGCASRERHAEFESCVSTDGTLPDWVSRKVYFANRGTVRDGENVADEDVEQVEDKDVAPAGTVYGDLMQRARKMFFSGGDARGDGEIKASSDGAG